MASLFPDDSSRPRSGGAPSPFRKFPKRPKAVETEMPPLPAGWIVAQCDGGARGNPGPAGFGAIVDSGDGLRVAELSEFLGFRTNNYAEYAGFLAVLSWALENGQSRLRVISDSELMVKQIQGKYKVNSPDLKPLHEEARRRIAKLEGFQIHHALRHKNKDADRLANEAMDRGMGKPPYAVHSLAGPAGTTAAEPRATPYPTRGSTPPAPASFGGVQEQRGLGAPPVGTVAKPQPSDSRAAAATPGMLRGFVRDGVVHLLGSMRLAEGSFVKIVPE